VRSSHAGERRNGKAKEGRFARATEKTETATVRSSASSVSSLFRESPLLAELEDEMDLALRH